MKKIKIKPFNYLIIRLFNHRGFTLAEVLITLGIIGVVASITIPILMNQIQDAQFKTAYRKAYSVACQAWQKAYTDNLLGPRADATGDSANQANFDAFKSEFDVVQDCSSNNPYSCWSSDGIKWDVAGGGFPKSTAHAFIDKSGMVWSQAYNNRSFIFVDINGPQKPNEWGRDRFPLNTYVNGAEANAGIPDSVHIFTDVPSNNGWCPGSHTCYYQSWITGAQ